MAEALAPALPSSIDALAQRVLGEACERGLKLATAESCTGGLLASLLTDIPGRSHAFERGFVAYTHAAKRQMLGVPAKVLEDEGAVSEACARAMASGALERSDAAIAVAVTGFAETGPEGEPAGLVHFACARRARPVLHRAERFGDIGRAKVRLASLAVALEMLLDRMNRAD